MSGQPKPELPSDGDAACVNHGWWVLRRFLQNRLAVLGAAVLLFLIAGAVMAPVIAPHDPLLIDGTVRLTPPGGNHLLGTDEFGRDLLSRILYGGRISLQVGALSVATAMLIGVPLGLVSGYYGGWLDQAASRLMDVFFAFPSILLAIGLMSMLGASLTNMTLAIAIVFMPTFARITRAAALEVRHTDYVQAAAALGARDVRVMIRHVLPNTLAPITVQATLGLGYAILAEASLSYLGLGTAPPTPAWGMMVYSGRGFMEQAPWVAVFPGLAIMLTVMAFNLCGDGLRDALDPRLKE